MPGRHYEMVEEPESMEIIDDGVYHPDLSSSSSRTDSFRTLEPIIPGPLTLKTIFYNPRWTSLQRKVCIGAVAIVSLGFLSVFIALIVGLANVIGYIEKAEMMKESGLFMVPNEHNEVGIFFYKQPAKDKKSNNNLIDQYISEIEAFLKSYEKQNASFVKCAKNVMPGKGQECKFDLNWLGTNCTKENKFGYYDGNPCILFGMKNLKRWKPVVNDEYLRSNEVATEVSKSRKMSLDVDHVPFACRIISHNFADSPSISDADHVIHYPDGGFKKIFMIPAQDEESSPLPPLVFVQLKNLQNVGKLGIHCRVLAANIQQLEGVRALSFDYTDGSEENINF